MRDGFGMAMLLIAGVFLAFLFKGDPDLFDVLQVKAIAYLNAECKP